MIKVVAGARVDPHARVRRLRRGPTTATGRARRGQGAGHDRRRSVAAARGPRRGQGQRSAPRRVAEPGSRLRPTERGPRSAAATHALRSPAVTVYVAEEFTPDEADILRRYFTNLDGPVFALVNLPEVVKGALFARYSRSAKSLRRLFLDEFVGDLDITRRRRRSTPRSACAGPRSSTTGCSSSTATTRWPSSAACTWPASRRRTCSPRCSSGAG